MKQKTEDSLTIPHWKKELNAKVLDIEFLLISVVQGVALTSLAVDAVGPMSALSLEVWPYIISGFIFILIFWSQAIIHALSFIDWPLDLGHSFLYFLASFVEVMAFSQIEHPLKWFLFVSAFLGIGAVLYIYDLRLIKKHQLEFSHSSQSRHLYAHMYTQQRKELTLLVPAAIGVNLIFAWLICKNPVYFLDQHNHLVLIGIQVLLGLGLLLVSVKSFKERCDRVTANLAES